MTTLKVLQDEAELEWFSDLLISESVRSYCEIGAKYGGSLKYIAARLSAEARIVTVDLPKGTKHWYMSEPALKNEIDLCRRRGQDVHVIWGDSTDPKVVERVRALSPFDALFIDANHSLPYVTKDWANYGPMARIVAFHDIAWHRLPGFDGTVIDVPAFWNDLKRGYRHVEKKIHHTGKDNGIGVLWRC